MSSQSTYGAYINSKKWKQRQKEYLKKHPYDELQLWGLVGDDEQRTLATNVHHIFYNNLGDEKDMDLCAVCDDTHRLLHSYFAPEYVLEDENLSLLYAAGNEICRFYYLQGKFENENFEMYKNKKKLTVILLDHIMSKYFDDMRAKNMVMNEYENSNKFIQHVLIILMKMPNGYKNIAEVYRYYKIKIEPVFILNFSNRETQSQSNENNIVNKNVTLATTGQEFTQDEVQKALSLYSAIKNVCEPSIAEKDTLKEKNIEQTTNNNSINNRDVHLIKNGHFNQYSKARIIKYLENNPSKLKDSKVYMGNWFLNETNNRPIFNQIGAKYAENFVKYISQNHKNGMIVLKNFLNNNF